MRTHTIDAQDRYSAVRLASVDPELSMAMEHLSSCRSELELDQALEAIADVAVRYGLTPDLMEEVVLLHDEGNRVGEHE